MFQLYIVENSNFKEFQALFCTLFVFTTSFLLTEFGVWLCGDLFIVLSLAYVCLKHYRDLASLCQTVLHLILMTATLAVHSSWWPKHSSCLFQNRFCQFNAVNKRWCLYPKEDSVLFWTSLSIWPSSQHPSLQFSLTGIKLVQHCILKEMSAPGGFEIIVLHWTHWAVFDNVFAVKESLVIVGAQ